MPSKWTFLQPLLFEYVLSHIPENTNVLIPFAGKYRITEYEGKGCKYVYNDLNPDIEADYHMEAYKLREIFKKESFGCIVADPPYTHYQGTKSYSGFKCQRITDWRNTANYLLKPGAIYIELGYNSTGLRMEIAKKIALGVCCIGGSHNDILILVQQKFGKLKLESEDCGDMLLV